MSHKRDDCFKSFYLLVIKYILDLLNAWWAEEKTPDTLTEALVASIYKTGNTELQENYRPISLLSSFEKISTILIRGRIQRHTEKLVTNTQYGFRPAKSTAHAIFIVRTLQDFAEKNLVTPYSNFIRLGESVRQNRSPMFVRGT